MVIMLSWPVGSSQTCAAVPLGWIGGTGRRVTPALLGIALPYLWESVAPAFDGAWFLFVPLSSHTTHVAAGVGVAEVLLGLWAGPYVLRARSRVSQAVLGPSDTRE